MRTNHAWTEEEIKKATLLRGSWALSLSHRGCDAPNRGGRTFDGRASRNIDPFGSGY